MKKTEDSEIPEPKDSETDYEEEEDELQQLKKELKEVEKETSSTQKTKQQCEALRNEIAKLKQEGTNEMILHEYQELLEEKKKLIRAANSEITEEDYNKIKSEVDELKKAGKKKYEEDLIKAKNKLLGSAVNPSTTKIVELEKKIRKEEARRIDIASVVRKSSVAREVDLCFLVDCTGSMEQYIQEVKKKIQVIVETSKRMLPDLKFSVAFVGYRDHCDGAARIVVLDFTTSISCFQLFIATVPATGGGDAAEDVFGGIEEVTKLSWRKKTRILIHIADRPCHGTRFHDSSVGDEYPNGDPRGLRIEELLPKLKALQITYWFIRLNHSTDLMIKVFHSIMEMYQIDLTSVDNLLEDIERLIFNSVKKTEMKISKEIIKDDAIGRVQCEIVSETPDWTTLESKNVRVWRNKIPSSLFQLREGLVLYCEPKLCSIKMASHPFSEGSVKIAYEAINCSENNKRLVLKRFIDIYENPFEKYLQEMETQSVAAALAAKFNKIKPVEAKGLHYVDVATVTFDKLGEKSHFSMERYIPGKYSKFTDNYGFVSETEYAATLNAFSHWTYWATEKYLMVVDFQGVREETSGEVRYVLTDPAIHSRMEPDRRFGTTDWGDKGMHSFFQSHYCNEICKALGLKRHRLQPMQTSISKPSVINP